MDGFKRKLTSSLQFRVTMALIVVMVIAAIAIGVIGFRSAFHDAHQLQDDQLRDIAVMVDTKRLSSGLGSDVMPSELEDPDSHVLVQLIDPAGKLASATSNDEIQFPNDLTDGIKTIYVQHKEWRVFVRTLQSGQKLVVGQSTEIRDEIALHAGLGTLMPMLALIPFLIILVIAVLRWTLAPLNRLSTELNARKPDDVSELVSHDLPDELRPFIVSLNAMLRRLAAVLDQQRRFVADAAHELRSPLTALSLQAQNLQSHQLLHELPPAVQGQLHEFRRGLKRANELVEQLLSLARAQINLPGNAAAVSLQMVVKTVFEEMMTLADSKKMELGFEQDTEIFIVANEIDLITLLRNLVDNAVRYANAGGRVDVTIWSEEKWAVISVQDNGPGIVQAERQRVFDPFYRILGSGQTGSGLGLSIVKSIVTKLHGEVSIHSAPIPASGGVAVVVKLLKA